MEFQFFGTSFSGFWLFAIMLIQGFRAYREWRADNPVKTPEQIAAESLAQLQATNKTFLDRLETLFSKPASQPAAAMSQDGTVQAHVPVTVRLQATTSAPDQTSK